MEEEIKNDLAGIAYTHPYFSEIVNNTLEYIEKLEKENKNYKKYAVMMSTDGLLINGVKFSFNDYIPISVIQNKIDELEHKNLMSNNKKAIYQAKVLRELLEERK